MIALGNADLVLWRCVAERVLEVGSARFPRERVAAEYAIK